MIDLDAAEAIICAVGVKHCLNIHPAIARDIACALITGDALGWNDKTSLSILADGVRSIRRALETWDTPTNMDLETLAKAIKARVVELEEVSAGHKDRIGELLEELAATTEERG